MSPPQRVLQRVMPVVCCELTLRPTLVSVKYFFDARGVFLSILRKPLSRCARECRGLRLLFCDFRLRGVEQCAASLPQRSRARL